MLVTILIILVILMLVGAIPRAGSYNEGWGWAPGGVAGLLLIILLILALAGRL